jgi:hypothetical protein
MVVLSFKETHAFCRDVVQVVFTGTNAGNQAFFNQVLYDLGHPAFGYVALPYQMIIGDAGVHPDALQCFV